VTAPLPFNSQLTAKFLPLRTISFWGNQHSSGWAIGLWQSIEQEIDRLDTDLDGR
jgi:hypothetical protein